MNADIPPRGVGDAHHDHERAADSHGNLPPAPLADFHDDNPIPDADAYSEAYSRGYAEARQSVAFMRLLLDGHDESLTDILVDDFASRYAALSLMMWPPAGS